MSSRVHELGKMTVFYVPSQKLDDPGFFEGTQSIRSVIHEFLMQHFRAYTQTPTAVKGYWIGVDDRLDHDVMERFEVSFAEEDGFDRLIAFLAGLCERLSEDAIYVTRGERSFLVQHVAD